METQLEIEKKNDMGRPSFGEQDPQLYFQQGLLYHKLYIEDNMGCETMQSQQSLILIKNQSFLPANLSYTNGLGDLHHLLARRPINFMTLDKGLSIVRLIFSE